MHALTQILHFGPKVDSPTPLTTDSLLYLISRQGEIGLSTHDIVSMLKLDKQQESEMVRLVGELVIQGKVYAHPTSRVFSVNPGVSANSRYISAHDSAIKEILIAEPEYFYQISELSAMELFVLYAVACNEGVRILQEDKFEGRAFVHLLNNLAGDFFDPEKEANFFPIFDEQNFPAEIIMSLDAKGFFQPRKIFDDGKQSKTFYLESTILRTYLLREAPKQIIRKMTELES